MLRSWIRAHPYLFVALLTCVVHTILFFGVFGRSYLEQHGTDATQYQAIAENLLQGNGFSLRTDPPYIPDTIRTPGYPFFLAGIKAVTGSFYPSLFLTLLLGCFFPLVGMRMVAWLNPDRRLWVLGGCLLAFDPNVFIYSFVFGSEGIFLPLVSGAMLLAGEAFIRKSWRWALGGGLLLGAAALVRPIVQFVPLLFFFLLLGFGWKQFRRQAVVGAAAFVLGYSIIVAPWLARNVVLFHAFDYANVGWFNMYTRVAASAEAIHFGVPYDQMRITYLQRLHEKGFVDASPVLEQDVHGYAFTPIFRRETLAVFKQYPWEVFITQVSAFSTVVTQDLTVVFVRNLGWVKSYPSFSPFIVLVREGPLSLLFETGKLLTGPWAFAFLMRFVWLAAFLLSLLAPFFAWRHRRSLFPIIVFLLFYDLGIIALSLNAAAQADARYRAQYIFAQTALSLFSLAFLWRKRLTVLAKEMCPSCQARFFFRPYGKRGQYPVWRCTFCRTVSVMPRPAEDVLRAFYAEAYFDGGDVYMDYEADKRVARGTLGSYLALIEGKTPVGRLLDVGAATGSFLEIAQERGWKVAAQEFSLTAAAKLTQKGIEVRTDPLASAYSAASFDAVTLLDVIEHVTDPSATLCAAFSLARPGGVLLVNTPDAGSWVARLFGRYWHAIVPPEHLTLFSRDALIQLIERCGFHVSWVGRVRKRFRLSYILSTFARWSGVRVCLRFAKWMERISWLNVSLPWPLNDNITIVARRPEKDGC